MTATETLTEIICTAAQKGTLRRLTLSKPLGDGAERVVCRLSLARGQSVLAYEETLGGGKVRHGALRTETLAETLPPLLARYAQINVMTGVGDAELRTSKRGQQTLIGGEGLLRRLRSGDAPLDTFVESLNREKQYILHGEEPFLRALGVSDATGRVHDKKQGKFRQINRFLEYVSEIYGDLPKAGPITVYDLCCGKSYLSFAVYHYLHVVRGREVDMLCMDLKEDVIAYCRGVAEDAGFAGMRFVAGDIRLTPRGVHPHLVVSLHACDIATDIVLETAADLGADVILSTPCCHRYLNRRLNDPSLAFVAAYPHLRGKLCEVLTEGLRLARLKSRGYAVAASELTDPDDTPKNTLLIARRRHGFRPDSEEAATLTAEYRALVARLTGDDPDAYLREIRL